MRRSASPAMALMCRLFPMFRFYGGLKASPMPYSPLER